MFMVVICRMLNGNNIILSPNQPQAAYNDVRHWDKLIDFINKNGRLTEPYILTSKFKCTLVSRCKKIRRYFGRYKRKIWKVWKELCYRKAETLEDAEEAARWWRHNLV